MIPAGARCRSTGPPGATTGRARLVGGLTQSGGTLPSARLRGSIASALRPQQTPGHWALGLVLPAGAGCRGTGPPGATHGRARLVGGLTQSGGTLPSARLGLYSFSTEASAAPGHWAPGEPAAEEPQTMGASLRHWASAVPGHWALRSLRLRNRKPHWAGFGTRPQQSQGTGP